MEHFTFGLRTLSASLAICLVGCSGGNSALDSSNETMGLAPNESSLWTAPDWSDGTLVPPGGRPNIYRLSESSLAQQVRAGRLHALHYPVEITGVLLPVAPLSRFLEADSSNPIRWLMQFFATRTQNLRAFADLEKWLGLRPYPEAEGSGVFEIPFKDGVRPVHAMGLTIMDTPQGKGFTISCAQCHAGQLFGRTVIGLTSRFPRANQLFEKGIQAADIVSPGRFQWLTEASDGETEMFTRSIHSLQFIAAQEPIQLGLDTSLSQVALSLARRAKDDYASRTLPIQARPERLENFPADSKPAVWWNVKYKNRWLSDGSVVSGNPIFTNFVWNEIGRGTDLHELDNWLKQNSKVVQELTATVFASQAPKWSDFFDADSFDFESAKRGEKLFLKNCAECHGRYEKAWALGNAGQLSKRELMATTLVVYPAKTPVIDVGTDPLRYLGMKSLEQLNDLAISKANSVVIKPQKGYVPPPLEGIWARWPYFHNNSVPSLCAVLTPSSQRPVTYWAREPRDPNTDFDQECNGYPMKGRPPAAPLELRFDTRVTGLSNRGHDEGIFLESGVEIFNASDKKDLVKFLQTL